MLLPLLMILQVQQTTIDVQPIIRGRLNVGAHAVWDPTTGKPMLVVPYAFTADALLRASDSIPVDMELRARDGRRDRRTTSPVMLTEENKRLLGHLVLPDVSRPGSWELKADLPWRHYDVKRSGRATPLDATTIAISDVVLGDSTLVTSFRLGESSILLAPHETVPADRPVEMFVQIRNGGEAREVQFDLRILRMVNRDPLRGEVLALRTPMMLESGITPMQRFLDLSHLDGSEYDMVISVLDDEGTVIARRVSVIRLRQPTGEAG